MCAIIAAVRAMSPRIMYHPIIHAIIIVSIFMKITPLFFRLIIEYLVIFDTLDK